jgi:hypothetical protein
MPYVSSLPERGPKQKLPPTIEDPTALDKIAAVFRLVKDSTAGQDAR